MLITLYLKRAMFWIQHLKPLLSEQAVYVSKVCSVLQAKYNVKISSQMAWRSCAWKNNGSRGSEWKVSPGYQKGFNDEKDKPSHEVQGSLQDSTHAGNGKREHDFFIGCRVLCRDKDDFLWLPGGIKSELIMWREGTVKALSPKLKVEAHGFDRAMEWDQVIHGRLKDFDLSGFFAGVS